MWLITLVMVGVFDLIQVLQLVVIVYDYIGIASNNYSTMNFLVVGDSHARCILLPCTSPLFKMITKAVSGLKWVDRYQQNLCGKVLLSSGEMIRYLSEADTVLFMIGTNSVRIFSAEQIIDQVKGIITSIRQEYRNLNDPDSITIALTFPCLKFTQRFSTERKMMENIDSFNERLRSLSSEMCFKVLDCHLTIENLGSDRIHIHRACHHLIVDSIVDHFDRFAQARLSSTTTSIHLDSSEASSSIAVEDKGSQSANRSQEALHDRNQTRFAKLKAKQQRHSIKRRICPKWTYSQLKKYLKSMNIRYGEIVPIANGVLKVQFNNQEDQDMSEVLFGEDKCDENHFEQFVETEVKKS
jgi:hypothetical protein